MRQKIFCADSCGVRVYFFFIAPEMPAAQEETFPFYACAHYTFNPNKKSLATDAIYCCSLFKHLTLFAGRTRKHCPRNLCQREQFESKSLRAQYVSHLFIQAGSPKSTERRCRLFANRALLYGQLCLQSQLDARPNLFYSSSIPSSICHRCRRFLFFAPRSRSQFQLLLERGTKNTTRDLDTRLSILMIHISLFLIRVHFNLLLNYLPLNITTITCSCDARFCSPGQLLP